VVLAAAGLLAWRILVRRLERVDDGIRVVTVTSSRTIPWSQVDHATVTVRKRSTKGGTMYGVLPTLVLRDGSEPVELGSAGMWTSGFDYRQQWVVRASTRVIEVLDAWLGAAGIRVDYAYQLMHEWNAGVLTVQDLARAADEYHPTLVPVSSLENPAERVAALEARVISAPPGERHPKAGARLVAGGAIFIGVIGAFAAFAVGFGAVDLATGSTVDVRLVASMPDSQCVVASVEDPAQTWTTDCVHGWTSAAPFTVRIGGLTDEPTRALEVVVVLIAAGLLMSCGLLPILIGRKLTGPLAAPVQPLGPRETVST
jgi:hypothetical protein